MHPYQTYRLLLIQESRCGDPPHWLTKFYGCSECQAGTDEELHPLGWDLDNASTLFTPVFTEDCGIALF